MKKICTFFSVMLLCYYTASSQGIAINADNSDPHTSAMLDVKSSSQGMLLPRMTEAQKKAIPSPAAGLIIYQTDAQKGFYVFDGKWQPLSDQLGNHLATENIRLGGYRLSNTDTTVGISVDENGKVFFKTKPASGNPLYRFIFDQAGSLTSNGVAGEGSIPAYGEGTRFMWYPGKAALRVGELPAGMALTWSEDSIGRASVSFGTNNAAAGSSATATGYNNSSKGDYSFTTGLNNKSYATGSITIGTNNTNRGINSLVLGNNLQVDGRNATAIGTSNTISSTGSYSCAIGTDAIINHQGCLVLSDRSGAASLYSSDNNQFLARFAGGFILYSNAVHSTGVRLLKDSNAWSIVSDSARKENYLPANGDDFLTRLRQLKLGSWNYKGIPQRHYGPMAQEFFAAFGKDQYGIIGNDTTINQADMEGVMMILIHALEARTNNQSKEISKLQSQNAALTAKLSEAASLSNKLDQLLALLQKNEATRSIATKFNASQEHTEESDCCNK